MHHGHAAGHDGLDVLVAHCEGEIHGFFSEMNEPMIAIAGAGAPGGLVGTRFRAPYFSCVLVPSFGAGVADSLRTEPVAPEPLEERICLIEVGRRYESKFP